MMSPLKISNTYCTYLIYSTKTSSPHRIFGVVDRYEYDRTSEYKLIHVWAAAKNRYTRSLWRKSGTLWVQVRNTRHEHSDWRKTCRTCFCPISPQVHECTSVSVDSVWFPTVFGLLSTIQKQRIAPSHDPARACDGQYVRGPRNIPHYRHAQCRVAQLPVVWRK